MPTLREIIDGTVIFAAAPVAKKPSPAAEHVSKHMQDPFGATKEGFQDLQEKKMAYDQSREAMQRQLAMPQAVIDQAAQLHGLTVGNNQSMMPGTPAMGQGTPGTPGTPGAQDNPDLDENGNPIPPNQTGMPTGGKTAGNPQNMSQTMGRMNSNRPSMAGFQPGVSPMDGQQVRPPKLGVAQPGKPIARNSPSPPGANNPQGNMYSPEAKPPKGNRSLPGAKGPGDNKVQKRTDKAQDKSTRSIKIHVQGSATSAYDIQRGAVNKLSTHFGIDTLRAQGMGMAPAPKAPTGGATTPKMNPRGGTPPNGAGPRGFSGNLGSRPPGGVRSKLSAGPSSVSDKVQDPQHDVAYNPVSSLSVRSKGKIKACKACGKMHALGACSMKARGHSLGAKKGWASRGKGHLAKPEKKALYETME